MGVCTVGTLIVLFRAGTHKDKSKSNAVFSARVSRFTAIYFFAASSLKMNTSAAAARIRVSASAAKGSVYLTYHDVTIAPPTYKYTIDRGTFEQHIAMAKQVKCGRRNLADPVFTFDDGFESSASLVAPALEQAAFCAYFFVTTSWVERRVGYMSWSQVRELAAHGHTVGSHGHSHKFLTSCSAAELRNELAGSRAVLEDHVGLPMTCVSIPGGRYNMRVLSACRDAGYETVFTSDLWLKRTVEGLAVIGRINVVRDTTGEQLAMILSPHSAWAYMHRTRHVLQTTTRKIIGDRAYHALWAAVSRAPRSQREEGVR